MTKAPSKNQRRFSRGWFFILLLFIVATVFYRPLVLFGVRLALPLSLPASWAQTLHYENIAWEGDRIVIAKLALESPTYRVSVDRIEIHPRIRWLHLEPKVTLVHPLVSLSSLNSHPSLPLPILYQGAWLTPQWEIHSGVLELPSNHRYYYHMTPGESLGEIGALFLSDDPDPSLSSMISSRLERKDDQLCVHLKLQDSDVSRLLPLTALVFPKCRRVWERTEGRVELEVECRVDTSLHVSHLQLKGSAVHIALKSQAMGIDVVWEECRGQLCYPTVEEGAFFWEKLSADIVLHAAQCTLDAPFVSERISLQQVEGEWCFAPFQEPQMTLEAVVDRKDHHFDLALVGRGRLQEDETFWSVIECTATSSFGNAMQAVLSLCRPERGQDIVQLKVDHADQEHLEIFRSFMGLPGRWKEGQAHFTLTWLFQNGMCQKAMLDSCVVEGVTFSFPDRNVTALLPQAQVEGSLVRTQAGEWRWDFLNFTFKNGEYFDANYHFSDLQAELRILDGLIQPSLLNGQWGKLQAKIALLGAIQGHVANVELIGDAVEVFANHGQFQTIGSYPIRLAAEVVREKELLLVNLNGEVCTDGIQGKITCKLPRDRSVWEWPILESGKLEATLLHPESYSIVSTLFLPHSVHLSGLVSCEALLSHHHLELKIGGEDLLLQHPSFEVQLPLLKGSFATISYDLGTGQYHGVVPVTDAKVYLQELLLPFDKVDAQVEISNKGIEAHGLYAECEGVALRGKLICDLVAIGGPVLTLNTSQIAGSLSHFNSALHHLPKVPRFDLHCEGSFVSGEQGLVLKTVFGPQGHHTTMQMKGTCHHLHFPLTSGTYLVDGRCDVSFDLENGCFKIEKGEGKWQLKSGIALPVQLVQCDLRMQGPMSLDLALSIGEKKRELAYIKAAAKQLASSQWTVAFDKTITHFAGMGLNISRCLIDKMGHLSSFEMRPTLRCQDLAAHVAILHDMGLILPISTELLVAWQLEGALEAQFFSTNVEQGFTFAGSSQNLKIKGTPLSRFYFCGQKQQEKWCIEKLETKDLFLKGTFLVDPNGIGVPYFEGKWKGIAARGDGYLRTEQKRFVCHFKNIRGDLERLSQIKLQGDLHGITGAFVAHGTVEGDYSSEKTPLEMKGDIGISVDLRAPLPLTVSTVKPMSYSFSYANGWECGPSDWECKQHVGSEKIAQLNIQRVNAPFGGDLQCDQMHLIATSSFLKHLIDHKILPLFLEKIAYPQHVEMTGALTLTKGGIKYCGRLIPGRYGINGMETIFDHLQLRYEQGQIMLKAKTHVQDLPLWASLQFDCGQEGHGVIKCFDHPQSKGMKFGFSLRGGQIHWEHVEGNCYGISCHLIKNTTKKIPLADVLTGQIQLDGMSITSLLPKAVQERLQGLKVGKGYRWHGNLILGQEKERAFQGSGVLAGEGIEMLGYRLDHLEGELEFSPQAIYLTNLRVEDLAGTVGIKRVELTKQAQWTLFIPQLIIHELQPSMLRKVDGSMMPPKPFVIKNFLLQEVRGVIGDKNSLEGFGHLTFTNQSKKEVSFLDFPLEMIKNLGLDPSILTPISGEVALELKGDRFYLLDLNHAFSEGERSEFYLAPTPDLSYIDLNGKMHIDLKLRQDVILKLLEPFTLTIRGTLDKPRYGIQY